MRVCIREEMLVDFILKETETMVCGAQKQVLRANSIKYHFKDQDVSPICRLCGELVDTVMHLSSDCSVFAKSKYRIRHDIVSNHIDCMLLKSVGSLQEISGTAIYPMLRQR